MAQDDYIRTALRVPPDLHKQLHEAAVQRGRSFNAEILGRLLESFEAMSEPSADREKAEMYRKLAASGDFMATTLCRYALALIEEMPQQVRASSDTVRLVEPFARSMLNRDAELPMAMINLFGLSESVEAVAAAQQAGELFEKGGPNPAAGGAHPGGEFHSSDLRSLTVGPPADASPPGPGASKPQPRRSAAKKVSQE